MIDIKEIEEFIDHKKEIYTKISKIIGYGSGLFLESISYQPSTKWCVDDEYLYLKNEDNEDPDEHYYQDFVISSYSSKNERFYMGESDGFTYVMAYYEDDGHDGAMIFILSNDFKDENQ